VEILFERKSPQEELQNRSLYTGHTHTIDGQKEKKISPGADGIEERKKDREIQLRESCPQVRGAAQ
jgi:hypothetical protein